ncbi:hypothetical protein ACS0TY_032776 [Phlomoides rotata]
MWPNLIQSGLKRTFSDHAPILLEASHKIDWGPIPFKMVNWWIEQKDFRILVENSWRNSKVIGWRVCPQRKAEECETCYKKLEESEWHFNVERDRREIVDFGY